MQVTTLGTVLVYLGTCAGALLALGALARYAVVRPLVRWMRAQLATPVRQISADVGADEDGPTLKDMIQAYGYRLSALEQRFGDHIRDHV